MILEGQQKFCDRVDECRREQTSQAVLNGTINAKLENIEKGISDIWESMENRRNEIRDLYFRIGLIGGGAGAISGLITAIVTRSMSK